MTSVYMLVLGLQVDNEDALVTITPNLSGGGFAYT